MSISVLFFFFFLSGVYVCVSKTLSKFTVSGYKSTSSSEEEEEGKLCGDWQSQEGEEQPRWGREEVGRAETPGKCHSIWPSQ